MAKQEYLLTQEGLNELQAELDELKTVKRNEIAEKIKLARSFGDLSENSEYDEAKNEQAKLENRIVELETMIKHSKIISDADRSTDTVGIGVTVKIFDVDLDEEATYQIVGSAEADPIGGKISDESPIGVALLGHKAGETVVAETPSGELQFKIIEIVNA
jgi:transcription elongation factor GreA